MRVLDGIEKDFARHYARAFRLATGSFLILPKAMFEMFEANGVDTRDMLAAEPIDLTEME